MYIDHDHYPFDISAIKIHTFAIAAGVLSLRKPRGQRVSGAQNQQRRTPTIELQSKDQKLVMVRNGIK